MRLYDRIAAALLWVAAFSFAAGVFFSITLLFRGFPPTEPVAIGLITIERYSKLKDYVTAALFLILVPPLTVWLQHLGRRIVAHERRRFWRGDRDMAVVVLFTLPLLLSPVFAAAAMALSSVSVVTNAFADAVDVQSKALGFDPAIVYVPHPIQNRTQAELAQIADEAIAPLLQSLQSKS